MKKLLGIIILLTIASTLIDCVSGKGSYKQGNYYQAVLDAVQRLRANPDHKKSVEVLRLSYPAAVSLLETQTQNLIAANDNNKWRTAVQNYSAINALYEEIQRSPGALRIIPKPVSKYNELTEAKQKAAEETYAMALDAMMKNTRNDAKRAYFLFKEANTLSPQYKESIEMGNQAKFNATLKVIVEPAVINATNWNYEAMVFGYRSNEFVRFYTAEEARNENLQRVDQYLTWQVNQYTESLPNISKTTREVTDSVKSGEKKVGDKVIDVYTKVTAKVTTFTKTVRGRASVNLIITDGSSKADIQNQPIVSEETWTQEWAIYTGDARALSQNLKQLAQRKEPFLSNNELRERVRQGLGQKFSQAIAAFYQNY